MWLFEHSSLHHNEQTHERCNYVEGEAQ
jgi:hypothetical protein